MKKTTSPDSKQPEPAARLEAVVGSIRSQIIDIGAPDPSDQDSDIRAEIIDFG